MGDEVCEGGFGLHWRDRPVEFVQCARVLRKMAFYGFDDLLGDGIGWKAERRGQ